jgi:hypothetical protein
MIDAVFVFMLTQNAADAMVKFFYGPVAGRVVVGSVVVGAAMFNLKLRARETDTNIFWTQKTYLSTYLLGK